MAVDAVLFDLDGTLLDTHDALLASFRHATRTVLGPAAEELTEEQLMAKVGQPLDTQMWDFTDDQEIHDRLLEEYRAHNVQVHDSLVKVFPGIPELLETLRAAGVPMGVVTSKRHDMAMRGLNLFGLADYLAFLVGSDDFPEHKPSPGPVVYGCELAGLAPERVLYVGDSPFDMMAGNGAGCSTAAVTWGMFPECVLRAENPTYVCDAPAQIAELAGA